LIGKISGPSEVKHGAKKSVGIPQTNFRELKIPMELRSRVC